MSESPTSFPTSPVRLRAEHLRGNDSSSERRPRLSWQLPEGAGRQSAFQLRVGTRLTDWVHSEERHLVPWPAAPLRPGERTSIQVRLRTAEGEVGDWSEPLVWGVLPDPGELAGHWLRPSEPVVPEPGTRPVYEFRTEFRLPAAAPAVAWVTAEGVYELFVNGTRVGDRELTPGFTSYHSRLQLTRHDITDALREGANTVALRVSDGWFRGRHGLERRADNFGTSVAVAMDLTVRQPDGGVLAVGTDASWRVRRTGSTADLMEGERHGLTTPGPWEPVVVGGRLASDDRLTGYLAPANRAVETLRPRAIHRHEHGVVVDFGQNLNGWVRVRLPEHAEATLAYGEWLDADGRVYRDNLRGLSLDTFRPTSAGQLDHVRTGTGGRFEPRHSSKGFRYVQIDGVGTLAPADIEAVMVHTDLERTGHFACSDDDLNRLHEAVVRSFRGNALDIPTDCPQRERSGFTGDWQVFLPTAAFLYDVAGFSRKWLADLAADQDPVTGRVPNVVPSPRLDGNIARTEGSAGWGDASVIVPWWLWILYGDRRVLDEQFASMTTWVEFARDRAARLRHPGRADRAPADHERYLWDAGFHFGEWLEPGAELGLDPDADHGDVATAYLYRSSLLLSRAAGVLGRRAEEREYRSLAARVRAAWRHEYLDAADGRVRPHRQASYVRALSFGLLDDRERPLAARHLADLVEASGRRLGTGFLSTADLLPVLADHGYTGLAHAVLTSRGVPSWLGMLDAGATTLWEKWEALDENGLPTSSLNHYSKGAVASFLHRYVAGLRPVTDGSPDHVAYRKVVVAPQVLGDLTWAEARLDTVRGPIRVRWDRTAAEFTLEVAVPADTTAEVRLPDGSVHLVRGGSHRYGVPLGPGTAG
ncbi:family 78 glycoside hydrolase catalytic domain [Streptomyces sp. NPDC001595]|uniref:family 78 glycoside hydrolase catalytic domain n=1 Tax=Streptomyces sp. NPDC001532 TaxID=3154520 RepID=UPI0033168F2F